MFYLYVFYNNYFIQLKNNLILPIQNFSNCDSKFSLYILRCKLCSALYVGQTNDIKNRIYAQWQFLTQVLWWIVIEKILFSILWTIVYILKGRGPGVPPAPPPLLDEVIFKIANGSEWRLSKGSNTTDVMQKKKQAARARMQ